MKRSEFYAMMIIVIIMCSMSTVFAVSYQPQIIQPTKIKEVVFYAASVPVNTYTTVLDTVGVGICSRISFQASSDGNHQLQIKVTVDGGTPIELIGGTAINEMRAVAYKTTTAGMDANKIVEWVGSLYFKSSIKIEIKHITYSSALAYKACVNYALE